MTVILLSDKRSGSTMFLREMRSHPDIQTVAYSPHNLETIYWVHSAILLKLAPETFTNGKAFMGNRPPAAARVYLIDCITNNVPAFQVPKDDRRLVFEGWEALCHRFAQPVFFEKSPQLYL